MGLATCGRVLGWVRLVGAVGFGLSKSFWQGSLCLVVSLILLARYYSWVGLGLGGTRGCVEVWVEQIILAGVSLSCCITDTACPILLVGGSWVGWESWVRWG